MNISIVYSREFEKVRIQSALKKMTWYKENGYEPQIPKGISESSSREEILACIESDYAEMEYERVANKITAEVTPQLKRFYKTLQNLGVISIPKEVKIYITNYGMGGSYNPPNMVIYNLHNNRGVKVVWHEMIHLSIEHLVQQHVLQQFEKERVVDLILNSELFSFLQYNKWQKDYRGTESYFDPLFDKFFFTNIQSFFAQISKRRPK
jgi:hypothetical protein